MLTASPAPDTSPAGILIARMVAKPVTVRETLIRQFFTDLTAPILAKTFILYMAGADQQVSTLNWASAAYDMTLSGTVSFTADRGFQGNGTSFYGDTGFTLPPANQNSVALYGVNQTIATNNTEQCLIGVSGQVGPPAYGTCVIRPNSSGANGITTRLMSTSSQTFTSPPANGAHWSTSRNSDAANYRRFKDGAFVSSTAFTSVQPATVPFFFMAQNQQPSPGTAATFSNARCSMAAVFSGLSDGEMTTVYNAAHAYLAAIGAE